MPNSVQYLLFTRYPVHWQEYSCKSILLMSDAFSLLFFVRCYC
jgi:hypothetical protein